MSERQIKYYGFEPECLTAFRVISEREIRILPCPKVRKRSRCAPDAERLLAVNQQLPVFERWVRTDDFEDQPSRRRIAVGEPRHEAGIEDQEITAGFEPTGRPVECVQGLSEPNAFAFEGLALADVLSDQLTAYALARPDAEQVALCVFVKAKVPRIEWHLAKREPNQVVEYFQKAEIVGHAIARGDFYKRPGWWCSGCDYLPVCIGDEAEAQRRLITARPR